MTTGSATFNPWIAGVLQQQQFKTNLASRLWRKKLSLCWSKWSDADRGIVNVKHVYKQLFLICQENLYLQLCGRY